MIPNHLLILRPEYMVSAAAQQPQGNVPLKTRSSGATNTTPGTSQDGGNNPNQDSPPGPCGDSMWMILAMVGVLYFVMIRPQQKQDKARKALIAAVVKGDRVVTNSGMHGTIVNLTDDKVTLRVDKDLKLTFDRSAIGRKLSDESEADKK